MAMIVGTEGIQDTLAGTDDDDVIWGGGMNQPAGGDTLNGGGGRDLLLLSKGDVADGGRGDDTIAIIEHGGTITAHRGGGSDHILGFGAGDTFRFADLVSPREVALVSSQGNVVFNIGGLGGTAPDHNTITLVGVSFDEVSFSFDEAGYFVIRGNTESSVAASPIVPPATGSESVAATAPIVPVAETSPIA
jgi:hypothetical protein